MGHRGWLKGPPNSFLVCKWQTEVQEGEVSGPALHGQAVAALRQGFHFLGFLGPMSITPLGLAARLSLEEHGAFSTQQGLGFLLA